MQIYHRHEPFSVIFSSFFTKLPTSDDKNEIHEPAPTHRKQKSEVQLILPTKKVFKIIIFLSPPTLTWDRLGLMIFLIYFSLPSPDESIHNNFQWYTRILISVGHARQKSPSGDYKRMIGKNGRKYRMWWLSSGQTFKGRFTNSTASFQSPQSDGRHNPCRIEALLSRSVKSLDFHVTGKNPLFVGSL